MGDGRTSPRATFETARLRLARYRVEGREARGRAAAHATQVSAEALEVERAGIWMLSDRSQKLSCLSVYSRSTRVHSGAQTLAVAPLYAQVLSERRAIGIADAQKDPLTRDLAASYLIPLGVSSLLDAPIFREGRVIGLVRHEHMGTLRTFSQRDLDFAVSVADIMSTIFEQADRLELEAALQEQAEYRKDGQKMEALGRIACAVAHDFNNVLGAVSLSTDLVLEGVDPVAAEHVRAMVAFGQRLTQQLLQFGKPHSETGHSESDLHSVVATMLPMLKMSMGVAVQLRVEVRPQSAFVVLEQSLLEQIILNLCINARDAVSSNGAIEMEVREPMADDEVPPDMLVLEVTDNGIGMDESTLARIFEPYFTTKPSGSGLGLATVYGIVRRAEGVLRATSRPGQGTTLFVALPRATGM